MTEHEQTRQTIFQAKDKGQWDLYKQMKEDSANPLIAVRRKAKGPQGQPAGTVATSPTEVDAIIRNVYGDTYKGDSRKGESPEEMAEKYIEEYKEFIFQEQEASIEEITGEDVQKVVSAQKETAGGMDQ